MPSNKAKAAEAQPEYKGEPLDDELANGPMAKRSCTDPLCCLLFVAFIAGMVGVSIYALAKGNPNLIGRGYDADGKMCGFDEGYEEYGYLYWPLPASDYLDYTVCVKACPTGEDTPNTLDCKFNSKIDDCTANYPVGATTEELRIAALAADQVTEGEDFYVYETTAFLKRFCIPTISAFKDASSTVLDTQILEQWISDIRETWPVILASMGVAFVIGFVYMILLRWCSGILTWFAILSFIGGTAVLGWRFYKRAQDSTDATADQATSDDETSTEKTINSEKVIAYVCWAVAGISAIAVLCLYNRIKLAIAIMKAAADYVRQTPSVFILPPVFCLILICLFGYWGVTAVFLVSCGDASQIEDTPFGSFTFNKNLQRLLIYHLFGLLWFNAFVIASNQFILASSTALWYFSQGTGQSAPKTIRTSVYRLFRYHLGSIAFGSLILAIVQFVRIVLAYMEAQAKKMAGKESKVIVYALKCLQCYVACFERFIKFLNKNAYIQMALSGKNFCLSAKDAFFLILRNPIRFSIVGGIASVFVLFGKVFVAAITALGSFLVITRAERFSETIYSPFIPTIVIFIFAYVIGAVFMSVYGMAADTILACFIVDEELQKKKNAPALHCPETLKEFLNKNKKN